MNAKFLIIFFLATIVIVAASLVGYKVATNLVVKKQAENQTKTLPFTNPFVQKPSDSFSTTPAFENPFATTPTPSYQNPFATTSTGDPAYTNPFEALR